MSSGFLGTKKTRPKKKRTRRKKRKQKLEHADWNESFCLE